MPALAAANPFETALDRYARNPRAFVREVLGAEPDPWQGELLDALGQGHTRLSVRSGHGVGKSTAASWTLVWFACTRFPFKAVITAPAATTLWDSLWAELLTWFRKLPGAWQELWDIKSDRIELRARPEQAFISARTSSRDKPEAMQGVHSAHVLLVVDEASAVDEAVFEAGVGSMSTPGAITLLLGNPTRNYGFFYLTHNRERDRWWTRKVSSLDSRRVDPAYIDDIREHYGVDTDAWRIRVLGEFAEGEGDVLISAGVVDEAMQRIIAPNPTTPEIWGVDVARFGTDASALVKRRGFVVTERPRRWRQLDLMALTGAVKHEFDSLEPEWRPSLIVVDVIGLGSGVVDRLTELGLPVFGANVSEAPAVGQKYARLRDEIWDNTKFWLETRKVSLPPDELLRDELVSPRYKFLSGGKLQLESKDEMRRRGLKSPDSADALTLTHVPAAAAIGVGGLRDWRKPVRRRIKGVA